MKGVLRSLLAAAVVVQAATRTTEAAEAVWLEAEHLRGIQGYCWPMGRPELRQTRGHWGLSGPGWAAEWNQGGESGFLSIATGAEDDQAAVTREVELPNAGTWHVWVRYADWREQAEPFEVRIEQPNRPAWTGSFGREAVVEEDNEMKLYWNWAFGWGQQSAELAKGPARVTLATTTSANVPRQVDVLVLTTDARYRPRIKDRPTNPAWQLLDSYRNGVPSTLEPLARRRPDFNNLPDSWQLTTFQNRGFLYLWNVSAEGETSDWLGDDPQRVLYPYSVRDEETIAEFKKRFGGQTDVPIFSDPRIVPTFHTVGAGIFATHSESGELLERGQRVARWLDRNPDRLWATMMNYHPGQPVGEKGLAAFAKYRDRYVGAISGESLGYFDIPADQMRQTTAAAATRRQLVDAFSPLTVEANAAKYRALYGRDLDANPFEDVVSCLSVGNIAFAPLLSQWGTRTVGYESAAATSSVLGMRWAFLRGIARQGSHLTATYRSCNFGDSSTIFSNSGSYHSPQNILDNYYSVFSGAGMTWYKMDLWYQYMAGASMFYHEQGFDEFWRPGGTTVAGIQEVQLSPKGKLVDRFLRVTAEHPDRGVPYTPAAFLVDYAHGWEPAPFWPNSFKNWHQQQDRFLYSDHETMLQEYFWTAYHPIGPESEKPMTGTNEVYVPGVFGDIFDCVFADPDVSRWTTIDTYPVVIAAGEIELTEAEGERLRQYVERGGTLLVAAAHLTGPGVARLELPAVAATAEADAYSWLGQPSQLSPRFRYEPIQIGNGRPLAAAPNGDVICGSWDRGAGRLIYLSVPHGLSITKQAVPLVAHLLAHLTRGLMPIEVHGDVQWFVNRTEQGWLVTLLNPAGQPKPQQGITPTDYRENRPVTIQAHVPIERAHDRLLPDAKLAVERNQVQCEVPAGAVRIVELR